jgi:HSP20 family molecular chaperone IbpA
MDAQFERLFVLPPEADMNKAKASFKKGVLEVHVPKIEQMTPRKVEIAA